MYRLAAILILTLLQGCSEISKYYIPEAPPENVQLHPGGSCGAPDATYIFNLAPGIDGFISARVGKEGWGLYYGFSISKGSKMQVIDPIFKIRDVDSGNEIDVPMQEFRLSVYGGLPGRPAGYFEKYAAGTELTYTGSCVTKKRTAHNITLYTNLASASPLTNKLHFGAEILGKFV